MLEEILELNRRAAASGNYESAYHLLMAALHVADHGGEAAALGRLADIGEKQRDEVEAVRPPHQLSRLHAQARGQTAVYDSFLVHVEAARLRMKSPPA